MKLLHIPKTGGTSILLDGMPGGHHISYIKGEKYLTIIRNPIDWTISYFQEKNEKNIYKDLDKWLEEKYYNFQTKWLAKKILNKNEINKEILEEIKKILKRDFKVITTENLSKITATHVNRARSKYVPTSKEIEKIKKNNKLDQELYEWARVTTL